MNKTVGIAYFYFLLIFEQNPFIYYWKERQCPLIDLFIFLMNKKSHAQLFSGKWIAKTIDSWTGTTSEISYIWKILKTRRIWHWSKYQISKGSHHWSFFLDAYHPRKVSPSSSCSLILQTKRCRILYIIMSIYMASHKLQRCYLRVSQGNRVKEYHFQTLARDECFMDCWEREPCSIPSMKMMECEGPSGEAQVHNHNRRCRKKAQHCKSSWGGRILFLALL